MAREPWFKIGPAPDKPHEKVKCRVVGANYAGKRRGGTVEVTQHELWRVGPRVLVSLDEERKKLEEMTSPPEDEKIAASEEAKREAWKKLENTRERMIREAKRGEMLEQLGGAAKPESKPEAKK